MGGRRERKKGLNKVMAHQSMSLIVFMMDEEGRLVGMKC